MGAVRLLVIEDDETYSKGFIRIIENVHPEINVKVAKNYDEAIKYYTDEDFDVLLVDLDLRGSSKQGWEIIEEIRRKDQKIEIYVLTGIEYEGIVSEPKFKQRYKVKKWLRKPLPALSFCELLYKDLDLI